MAIIRFLKNWTLPISMITGVIAYFVYVNIPGIGITRPYVNRAVSIIQPLLIFAMLFLTFCKVNLKDLHFCKWHLWLLLVQSLSFTAIAVVLVLMPHSGTRIILEGAMICLICPTATAGAVITKKLGGNAASLTTYTIFINLVTALLVPTLVPFVHPHPEMSSFTSFVLIIGKVFPLLLLPFVAAVILRYVLPALHEKVSQYHELSFYLWAVALALAIAVTVKSIVHSNVTIGTEIGLAIVSLLCCGLQFWIGRKIGRRYGDPISAGQSLGQKNTVLAIWMGYTFFSPITAIAGGFYSVWHNVVNSYQLYKERKKEETINKVS
ncbi:transporter [uncultured Bacteroides sp.]|uniref:bile acid:sodium symporter family protein n=1 Tax=uncultured Bacteroides sp. TaxID=162156 RepID=UPI0026260890|nr:transporter [uncultured Bacteroides sp.]